MDKVVHFEIVADDTSRAKAFYNAVFGWDIQSVPGMGYHFVFTTPIDPQSRMPTEPGAINGGMMARNPVVDRPVITVAVEDVEASLAAIAYNGGSQVGDLQRVGDMGIAAYFKDSEGNLMGLWQSLR